MEILKNISTTKFIFLMFSIVLSFQTIRNTIHWESNELFQNVMLMIVSFYFWQKQIKSEKIDSLVNNEEDE